MEKILACAYTRFSTDQQNQSSTIGQLKAIRKFCKNNNIELIDTYIDEAQSGTNMDRVSFKKMMSDAPTALWSAIVVYNMSRLSRSVKDTLIIKDELQKYGKKVYSVIENQDETPEGDFFNLITYGMNELFVKQFKRDSWRGLLVNANSCKVQGGVPLFGYYVNKDKTYSINEEEAEIVRLIFKMIDKGKSYREVATYLNSHGYTRRGKPFNINITDTLRNEKYAGVYVWNLREGKSKLKHKTNRIYKPKEEVIRIEGGMPQIIDTKLFNRVQAILDQRKRHYKQRGPKTKYLLSSLLVCGKCGHAYSGEVHWIHSNEYIRADYRCNGAKVTTNKCNNKDINMEYLNTYIKDLIQKVILSYECINAYQMFINEYFKNKNNYIKECLKENNKKRDDLRKQFEDYVERLKIADDEDYLLLTKMIGENTSERTMLDKQDKLLKDTIDIESTMSKEKIRTILRGWKRELDERPLKDVVPEIIYKIVMNENTIDTFVNITKIFGVYENGDIITIHISELRENVAIRFNHNKISFTEEVMRKALQEKLKELY